MLIDKKSPDLWLFVTVIILLAIGISMVFSSSYIMAYKWYGDSYYFFKKTINLCYNSPGSIFLCYVYGLS